jgi:hypothetical protein
MKHKETDWSIRESTIISKAATVSTMYLPIDDQSCCHFSTVLLVFILFKQTIRNWITPSSNTYIIKYSTDQYHHAQYGTHSQIIQANQRTLFMIISKFQHNTTVALFIKPNHICIYHQNHIKLAGRVCIDCTIRGSVMSRSKGITIVVMIATWWLIHFI